MVSHNDDDHGKSTQGAETNDSRRRFLAGSAGALGALTLGSAFGAQSALAEEHEDGTETEGPMEDVFEDDLAILNYALTLEYLEAAFYGEALDNMDADDVTVEWADELPESIRERVYDRLTVIQEHEETHVEFLTGVVEDLGGDPVDEPEFDFGSAVEEPAEFLSTAAVLEDTGVGAYAGAAPFIEDESLVPPALSIHSVEARHAAFVRELGGQIGFPDAFDEALPKDQVLEAASQFIVSDAAVMDDGEDDDDDEDDDDGEDDDDDATETEDDDATETDDDY
ncbi:ferritin-like domain-containing protein [Halobacteria archaeon HArc-gm2]|nr:ferritin-like domain-containing protein [Halobacteria archaeon HArc-gm2]